MKRLLLSLGCVMGLTLSLAGTSSAQGYGIYYGSGGYGSPGGPGVSSSYRGGFGYSQRLYPAQHSFHARPAPVHGYPAYYQGYRGPNVFTRHW